jgi:uncharacterized protein
MLALARVLGFLALHAVLLLVATVPLVPTIERLSVLNRPQSIVVTALAGNAALLAASWLLLRFIDRRPLVSLGFNLRTAPRHFLGGTVLALGWLGLTLALVWAFGRLSRSGSHVALGTPLAWAAAAVIANALQQELLVHGYVFQALRRELGPFIAVVMTAAGFAVWHADAYHGSVLAAVNVFLAGATFGALCWRSGNLWMPVAAHATWNFLVGPALGLTLSGTTDLVLSEAILRVDGPALVTGGTFGVEGGLAVTLATATALTRVARRGR